MSEELRFPSVTDLAALACFGSLTEPEQDALLPVVRYINNTVAATLRRRTQPEKPETA